MNCENPESNESDRRLRLLNILGVSNISNTFKNAKNVPGYEKTLTAFKEMATGTADYSLLMIYGGAGNGKSRGCESVVIEMFDRGFQVKRDRWSDIVRSLKAHFNGRGAVSYEEYFSDLRSRARIIFDDVGSGTSMGPWEWGELEDIIDYRYERQMFTILTTNIDIKKFPERILSRFLDLSRSRLIRNDAPDQRPLQGGR